MKQIEIHSGNYIVLFSDIPGHRIPVKCSLKNFDRENDYVFLVRGKDSHGRVGSFSDYALARK